MKILLVRWNHSFLHTIWKSMCMAGPLTWGWELLYPLWSGVDSLFLLRLEQEIISCNSTWQTTEFPKIGEEPSSYQSIGECSDLEFEESILREDHVHSRNVCDERNLALLHSACVNNIEKSFELGVIVLRVSSQNEHQLWAAGGCLLGCRNQVE